MTIEEIIYKNVTDKIKILDKDVTIKDDTDLIYDLGLDSLSLVELIADLESELDIEIDGDDIEKVLKYGKLVELIKEKKSKI